MTLVAGIQGLLSALLLLGVHGDVPLDELSPIQNKAVRLVMENFHKRDLKNSFRVSSVLKAREEDYSAGIFVNVEFLQKQTTCQKHLWERPACSFHNTPMTYNCFACFKFEYETHAVISQVIDCILPRHVTRRVETRNRSCKEVELKDPGKKRIGTYSFLKSGETSGK